MITIAISSDAKGHGNSATLLASILRRTRERVWVRCWCRGYSPVSFETGRLKVEFIGAEEAVTGRYPGHVNEAVFDRLRVIRDCPDWERCLVMDHDMAVLCDLAEYFAEDFEGNLLMGRLFGPGNTLGLQMARRGGLPEGWLHAEGYPYFYMGPMMNLAAMREEGIWEKLLAAHAAIGQDEQLALTAACGGRTKGVGRKWNLVPQWDKLGEAEVPLSGVVERSGVRWRNGVPEGLIHWTGHAKPWHRGSKVWRADVWEGERTSWEELRLGLWEKPLALEVEPEDGFGVRALARRGWRVRVFGGRFGEVGGWEPLDERDVPFPDVANGGQITNFKALMTKLTCDLRPGAADEVCEVVRFGPGADVVEWLEGLEALPEYVAVAGPRGVEEVKCLRALGYGLETRIRPREWPTGGPAPRTLEFLRGRPALAVGAGEELYLRRREERTDGERVPERDCGLRSGAAGAVSQDADRGTQDACAPHVEWPWKMSAEAEGFLERLAEGGGTKLRIVELGSGHGSEVLARLFPQAEILSLEHHAPWYADCLGRIGERPGLKMVHAPLDGTLPWYDCREVDFGGIDLLVVNSPDGEQARAVRRGAVCLRRHLKPGAKVLLDGMESAERREAVARWRAAGGVEVEEDGGDHVVLRTDFPPVLRPAYPEGIAGLRDIAEKVYVISLPEREDRRKRLEENWKSFGLDYEPVEGVKVAEDEVLWREMKGMEAYGKAENLRGGYIPGAVGCKRAGIRALKTFLESGAKTALICQDDCRWKPDAVRTVDRALRELPEEWDLVYFSASSRERNSPWSPHLVRLGGARYCNAILWSRFTAMRLLPELEACDCEWDLFMQRAHGWLRAYCVAPMPAYQARSRSDIVRGVVQPPNR